MTMSKEIPMTELQAGRLCRREIRGRGRARGRWGKRS